MSTNSDRATLRASLRAWDKRRQAIEAERNPLVRAALAAGISIEDIHKDTNLARTTIDRIAKEASDG